jgi:hypothetical protein
MKPTTTIDKVQPIIFTVAPNPHLVRDLRQMIEQEESQQFLEAVAHEYDWYTYPNKRLALKPIEALTIASQMQLALQAKLYAAQVFDLVMKDVAERVHNLAVHKLRYQGEIRYRQYPLVRGQTFRELIKTEAHRRHEWVFDPIERFAKVIPLHALKAIRTLTDEGITPEAYWVADKIETVIERPRSIDPILCAQFGQWLVGIAMWL